MHQTEAEGQKPVSGILSGKRRNANRHNAKRRNANRHNAKRHNANRHNAKRHNWHNANRHNVKRHNANRYNVKRHNAFPTLKFWMLIKFDFSSKKAFLLWSSHGPTAILKIETLRMRRHFARVFLYGGICWVNKICNKLCNKFPDWLIPLDSLFTCLLGEKIGY